MPGSETCQVCGATFQTREALMDHAAKAHPMGTKSRWPPAVDRGTYLRWAALGGLLGGVAMALVMMAAGQALLGDGIAVVCSMGVALIGLQATSTPTTVLGLVLHFIAAIIIGVVIATVTLAVRNRFAGRLAITNAKNGTAVGVLAGFAVWLVWGLPLMLFAMAPAMVKVMAMMMPGSNMMMAEQDSMMMLQSVFGLFIAAWLVAHLAYGAVLGATTGYAAAKKAPLGVGQSVGARVAR